MFLPINYKNKSIVDIDNELNISQYENDINFTNQTSHLKPIALYYPDYNYINENLSINRE